MSDFHFASRRSPVYARRGIVAASQPLAAAAGVSILAQGGNAADAAVATAAALNVTEPTSTGLGGDCFALFYDARTRLVQDGFTTALDPYHAHCVTVPGACAGWCDLIERHGSLPLRVSLAPAIR